MRTAGERTGAFAVAAGAAVACFCALFFGGGFDDAPLVWIGGLALVVAGGATAAATLRLLPAPALDGPTAAFVGCLLGLAAWAGLTLVWSTSPDTTWAYTNRTLVYAAFALAGVLLAPLLRRPAATAANALSLLLALVFGWALLAKCVPALYSGYARIARLTAPVGYWNELALLAAVAVPLALRLAAPRGRRTRVRIAGALLLYAAALCVLLTYSRFGVALAVAAAVAWTVLERERVESIVASLLAGGVAAAVFGAALALPGITSDGQSRAVRAHDGWIFALAVVGGAVAVAAAAAALATLERRRPLPAGRRRAVERAAGAVASLLVLAGIAVSIAFAHRIWSEFTNPVSAQITNAPGRGLSLNSSNRWLWWREAWHAFTRHPGGGTGAGTFQLTDLLLRRTANVTTVEPHNTPLQFLSETGIVGFLLYLGAFAAAGWGAVRARAAAADGERDAATALGLVAAAFAVHTVVDMDWNYVATCGPLLLATGVLVGGGAAAVRTPEPLRRPLLATGAVGLAAVAVYSLTVPWLAQRHLATGTEAGARAAHALDPLSVDALVEWAAFEDRPGHYRHAEQLYRDAVELEPHSSDTWYALGAFYFYHGAWKRAYVALNNAYTYDRFGPAGDRCGLLDRARWNAFREGIRCRGSGSASPS